MLSYYRTSYDKAKIWKGLFLLNILFLCWKIPESELLMTWPQPSFEELRKYYNSSSYIPHKEVSDSVFDTIYQWTRSRNLVIKRNWLRKIFPDKGALLDYGCGTGFFLQSCQKDGWNIKGIEPSLTACLSARKKKWIIRCIRI